MIVGVRGNLGNGKTATLAWLAHHYYRKGYKIHSNFWLEDIDFNYVTCIEDIEKIRSGYVFFDELWTWIDSRGSGFNDINQIVTGILHKSRKRGYSIFYESKLIHMTDRRIRELTDYVLEPEIFISINGCLEKIDQDMLEPIDMTPFLPVSWVVVGKYEFVGDNLKLIDDNIQFPLSEVVYTYNTSEEISGLGQGERSAGFEKGMKVENVFAKYLQSLFPEGKIRRGAKSRGWDVVYEDNGNGMAFDVVSIRKPHKGSINASIDLRGKRIKQLIDNAKKAKLKPFWAYFQDGKWYKMKMEMDHAVRSTLSCKNGEPFEPNIQTEIKYKKDHHGKVIGVVPA